LAKNFGGGTIMCVLSVLFNPIMLLYIVLSDRAFVNYPMHPEIAKFLHDLKLDDDIIADDNLTTDDPMTENNIPNE
jgi:hypothetical protein